MDLSIITVTWNSAEFIADQIQSVKNACSNISYEHFIVDNASSDATLEIVEKNFPDIKLIKNSSNVGFAAANNRAVKQSQGRFLLFLNPDMRCVGEKSLDTMVQWLEQHPTAGIAGPFLVNGAFEPRLELTPCHFPSLTSLLITALKLPLLFPFILHRFYYSMGELSHDLQVDTLRGSALFMRRELVDALGFAFDPRYFIWFEDVDICREAYRLGFKVMYVNSVKMVDYRGQSFKKQDMVKKQKQFFKSAIIYLKKWEPRYKSIILWIVQWFGIGGVWVYSKSGRKLKMKDAIER